ncbi:MAG: ATP-binding protein [Gammaproteobacteria bacterium]|nr:ATP-binding protein [Gammaproteobacteria bacterium]
MPSPTATSTSLLQLIATVHLHKTTIREACNVHAVIALANSQANKLNTSLASRKLKHAIYHLTDNSQDLYLRELLQNALDASSDNMRIEVEFFHHAQTSIMRFTDTGTGMNLHNLFIDLLVPGNSSKRENNKLIGNSGVGFFSAFADAKEINIKTSTGDGQTYYFKLMPCYDTDIIDISVTADQKNEYFKGTLIERISLHKNPEFQILKNLHTIRQYGKFIDPQKVKVFVNQTQINHDLVHLGELHFEKIGTCKIYSDTECALTAGGLFVKNIDDFYWHTIPKFMMLALKHHGISIDFPGKIALVRQRNNFQNADQFIEYFKPLFFQLCLNAYCLLLKNGKISDDYLPYDLFNFLEKSSCSLKEIEFIKNDIEAINQNQLLMDYQKYLDHDLCIKLLIHINFISFGPNKLSIAAIAQLNHHSHLQYENLPNFIVQRLKIYQSHLKHHHRHHHYFTEAKNLFEKQLQQYQYSSWNLPIAAFENAPNWQLFYNLIRKITERIEADYALKIDIHFSVAEPAALAYIKTYDFEMITDNNNLVKKKTKLFINPLAWWRYLNKAFSCNMNDIHYLITELVETISHEISHLIEGSGCGSGVRALTHDHHFKETHMQVYSHILMQFDLNQLKTETHKDISAIIESAKLILKHLPNAKELMIMQLLNQKNYLCINNTDPAVSPVPPPLPFFDKQKLKEKPPTVGTARYEYYEKIGKKL